ncbi:MAG: lycopene cyclase family protein [Cyclobacteriaceae bacterium]
MNLVLPSYDYIIAGGGCAGLSLVHHLLNSSLRNQSILVIEPDNKQSNDRTWSFWETGINLFEDIVFHRWQEMDFHGAGFSKTLNLSPYTYKMIRGIDFYRYVREEMQKFPNAHWLQGRVDLMEDTDKGARVIAGGEEVHARWLFSSIRSEQEKEQARHHNYLLQHFKGWQIRTPAPFFDPGKATLMDFRIEQEEDCRFVYVLPTSADTALVEYTIFSENLLDDSAYDHALIDYMRNYLQLDDYTIEHEEFGVIPMTDMPYPSAAGKNIVNIGTAGGITKPSTGYTFKRIQRDSAVIVQRLEKGESPRRQPSAWEQRFRVYDSTLLNVMAQHYHPARDVFRDLFKNNPAERVLRFLDEDTSFLEEIKVANSVPKLPFIRGMWKALKP